MSPTDPPTQSVDAPGGEETPTREELARRVDVLAGLLDELGEHFNRVLKSPAVAAQSWLLVDDAEAARGMLADLLAWLDSVYLRYAGAKLPECWAYHPEVVEELLALRAAHREALGGLGWGTRSVQWHNMYRPAVVARIHSMIGPCDLSRHGSPGQPPLAAPGAAHLDPIAAHWVTHGVPPEPTEQELQQAREYSDRLLDRPSS